MLCYLCSVFLAATLNSVSRFSDSRLWRPAPLYVIRVGTEPMAGWIWVLAALHS